MLAERLGRAAVRGARRGSGNGVAVVCNSLLVQRGAPDELRGRVFTVIMSTNFALLGLGMIVAGPLTDASARAGLVAAAAIVALAAVVGFLLARGAARSAVAERGGRARAGRRRRRRADSARPSRRPTSIAAMAGRRDWTRETLAAGVRAGDRRALARAISLVENGDPLADELVRDLYPETGRAYTVGVTGPPGVGKSSLIGALVAHVRGLGPIGRRDLGRPVEPVLAGRAARRPDPARRPLPRPGRVHPLDGDARPPRRPRGGDAPGAAAARRGGEGRRSSSRPSAPGRARSR